MVGFGVFRMRVFNEGRRMFAAGLGAHDFVIADTTPLKDSVSCGEARYRLTSLLSWIRCWAPPQTSGRWPASCDVSDLGALNSLSISLQRWSTGSGHRTCAYTARQRPMRVTRSISGVWWHDEAECS